MTPQMLFIIGAPRSGTTMLERMLASHSHIQGGPEPHLLTPLAHLGIWDNVDKAPYDHILAAESQKLFIEQLPQKEQDYWDACRAYCEVLYSRYTQVKGGKPICLDKTPAYALVTPFIMKVFPDAKYILLTRHPLAIFSSFANSFFDGDYQIAQDYNPLLNRYVPALAQALRQTDVAVLHVRYEDLVKAPEEWFSTICEYIGVPFEEEAVNYGSRPKPKTDTPGGLGDPIGVQKHTRPSTASVKKWVQELASDPQKRKLMEKIIAQLSDDDLALLGYPKEKLWQPLLDANTELEPPKALKLDRYRLQRKMIITLRAQAQKRPALRRLLQKGRLFCDVLLRE